MPEYIEYLDNNLDLFEAEKYLNSDSIIKAISSKDINFKNKVLLYINGLIEDFTIDEIFFKVFDKMYKKNLNDKIFKDVYLGGFGGIISLINGTF